MSKKQTSRQTFSVKAPGANRVQLVGDFTDWQRSPITMAKLEGGVWQTTIALEPGTYHYRFLIDGAWRDDPECTLRVANPYGSENAVRHVG